MQCVRACAQHAVLLALEFKLLSAWSSPGIPGPSQESCASASESVCRGTPRTPKTAVVEQILEQLVIEQQQISEQAQREAQQSHTIHQQCIAMVQMYRAVRAEPREPNLTSCLEWEVGKSPRPRRSSHVLRGNRQCRLLTHGEWPYSGDQRFASMRGATVLGASFCFRRTASDRQCAPKQKNHGSYTERNKHRDM